MEKNSCLGSDKQPMYDWRGKWAMLSKISHLHICMSKIMREPPNVVPCTRPKSTFYEGFLLLRVRSYDSARSVFSKLSRRSDGWDIAGVYWSSQSYLEEKNYAKALELANQILDNENALKWYQLLLQQQLEEGWFHEEGQPLSYEKEGRYIFHDTNLSRFTGHSRSYESSNWKLRQNVKKNRIKSRTWYFPNGVFQHHSLLKSHLVSG